MEQTAAVVTLLVVLWFSAKRQDGLPRRLPVPALFQMCVLRSLHLRRFQIHPLFHRLEALALIVVSMPLPAIRVRFTLKIPSPQIICDILFEDPLHHYLSSFLDQHLNQILLHCARSRQRLLELLAQFRRKWYLLYWRSHFG